MAIHHALSGELINIRPLGSAFRSARTVTLYKMQHLEVLRMVLLTGKEIPEHKVAGELTVQWLEGSVEFSIGIPRDVMRLGDLECLGRRRLSFAQGGRRQLDSGHPAPSSRLGRS